LAAMTRCASLTCPQVYTRVQYLIQYISAVDNQCNVYVFLLLFFFTHAETPLMLRFVLWCTLHGHCSWPRSGDCVGSRIRTRDSCVLCLVSPSCFKGIVSRDGGWGKAVEW
jgi:hypothetical protein